jgi:hypothetical protein
MVFEIVFFVQRLKFHVSYLALISLSLPPVLLASFGGQNISKSYKTGEERGRETVRVRESGRDREREVGGAIRCFDLL